MNEVRLVGITTPNTGLGLQTAGELIAYAARVSNPSNQMNLETAPKLLKYLIKNKHWSPFEMVSVTMEIVTTRDIARQILRHRSFSFQEFSQRYADPTSMGFEFKEARLQDSTNRQNSIEIEDPDLKKWWEHIQWVIVENIKSYYSQALERGIAKEQARAILPEGLTISRMYMAGTLRSWIHYIQLRTEKGTQKEHREVACRCADVIKLYFPDLREYLDETTGTTK